MKFFTAILTVYFVLLSGVPSLRVLKSGLSDCCANVTEETGCCKEDKKSETCQKEKCILNISFSAGQFIVEQIQNLSIPLLFETDKQENLIYEKTFIPNYYNTFWHPPEMTS